MRDLGQSRSPHSLPRRDCRSHMPCTRSSASSAGGGHGAIDTWFQESEHQHAGGEIDAIGGASALESRQPAGAGV
jgi:hypothetical protein